MDLYSCLEREFKTGDYKKAVNQWVTQGRRSDHLYSIQEYNGLFQISDFFENNSIKIDRVLLGPWGFILRKRIEKGDFHGVQKVLDIYKMKKALRALEKKDEASARAWLNWQFDSFFKREKFKILVQKACQIGNVDFLVELKEKGASLKPFIFSDKMQAPMMQAAKNGQVKVVVYLLLSNVSHHFFDQNLKKEFKRLDEIQIDKKAELILKDGEAFLEYETQKKQKDVSSMFFDVGHYQTENSLLTYLKKDPFLSLNTTDETGELFLKNLFYQGKLRDIDYAIDMGIDFGVLDENQEGISDWCLTSKNPLFFECLEKRGYLDEVTLSLKKGLLTDLIEVENKEMASFFIQHELQLQTKNIIGKTPLIASVLKQNKDLFFKLLEKDIQLDLPDSEEKTPLFYALKHFEELDDQTYFEALVEKGANIDYENMDGTPLLMDLIHKNYLKAADLLIEAGANLLSPDAFGVDSYNLAMQKGNLQLAKKIFLKVRHKQQKLRALKAYINGSSKRIVYAQTTNDKVKE